MPLASGPHPAITLLQNQAVTLGLLNVKSTNILFPIFIVFILVSACDRSNNSSCYLLSTNCMLGHFATSFFSLIAPSNVDIISAKRIQITYAKSHNQQVADLGFKSRNVRMMVSRWLQILCHHSTSQFSISVLLDSGALDTVDHSLSTPSLASGTPPFSSCSLASTATASQIPFQFLSIFSISKCGTSFRTSYLLHLHLLPG